MSSSIRSTSTAVVIVFALVAQVGAQSQGLANTSWQLVQIHNADGTSERPDDPAKYTLEFEADGSLVARLNCNRGHGTWKSTSPGQIEFGVMAVTMAMCLPPSLDTRMAKDLGAVHAYAIENGHLHLNLSSGGFYEFAPEVAASLPNTSWQLVEIRNADGTWLNPDDPTKYTVRFDADGDVYVRLDCNHGRGTWKSTASGQLELGPLALTRMMCPAGSLSDRIAKDWSTAQSYGIDGGHLRLTFSGGDHYEFEPFAEPSPAPS
jgi:heat shock protein HslJ